MEILKISIVIILLALYYCSDVISMPCRTAAKRIVQKYFFILLAVIPLIYSPVNHYYEIDVTKYRAWLLSTVTAMALLSILTISGMVKSGTGSFSRAFSGKASLIDLLVSAWIADCFISFLLSENKKLSFAGYYGWYTGFGFQILLALIYYFFSRYGNDIGYSIITEKFTSLVMIFSGVVFFLAILNRLGLDPLHMYDGVSEDEIPYFVSTIGQSTWYSSFLCLLLAMGISWFIFSADTRWKMVGDAVYLWICFGSLVTQNSDSAFAAAAVILILFFCYSWVSRARRRRYGITFILMNSAFIVMGMLHRASGDFMHFGNSQIPSNYGNYGKSIFADSLVFFQTFSDISIFLMNSWLPWVGLILGFGLIVLSYLLPDFEFHNNSRRLGWIAAAVISAGVLAYGAVLKSSIFMSKTDIPLRNYLVFSGDWGNGRGYIWQCSAQLFRNLSLSQKIFGIGPGMYGQEIRKYTGLALANAHNEWLTALIEYGIVGGSLYLAIFIASIVICMRAIYRRKDIRLVMPMTMCAGYLVHQTFCYQQCIATPVVFAMIGLCESGFMISGRMNADGMCGSTGKHCTSSAGKNIFLKIDGSQFVGAGKGRIMGA